VCSTELFFYDDFSTNPTVSGWDVTGGYWAWDSSNDMYVEDTNGWGLTWVPDFKKKLEDVVIEVLVRPDNDIYDAGVMFRVPDPGYGDTTGAYYYVRLDPGLDRVELTYWQTSFLTTLDQADYDIDAGNWYDVIIRADGGNLDVWVDQAIDAFPLLSAADKNLTYGSFGFRTSYSVAAYDEIIVCW